MTYSRQGFACTFIVALLLLAVVLSTPAASAAPLSAEDVKPKKEKFKGEVLAMTRTSLIVRSRDNYNLVRTFTFDKKLAAKMAKLIDSDKAYGHGDRVEVHYLAGTTTAVDVKGKPRQKR